MKKIVTFIAAVMLSLTMMSVPTGANAVDTSYPPKCGKSKVWNESRHQCETVHFEKPFLKIADTPRCVTHREFRSVRKGMKKWRVHRIFDVRGQRYSGRGYTRWHGSCASLWAGGGDTGASVKYSAKTNRVVKKHWG